MQAHCLSLGDEMLESLASLLPASLVLCFGFAVCSLRSATLGFYSAVIYKVQYIEPPALG